MRKPNEGRGMQRRVVLGLLLALGIVLVAFGVYGYVRAYATGVNDSEDESAERLEALRSVANDNGEDSTGGDTDQEEGSAEPYVDTTREGGRNNFVDASELPDTITDLDQAESALDVLDSKVGEHLQYDSGEEQSANGMRFYRFQQEYQDIPVYGRSSTVIVSASGEPVGISTNAIAVGSLSTDAAASYDDVLDAAKNKAAQDMGTSVDDLGGSMGMLVVYSIEQDSVLAYQVYIGDYEVFVDANTGAVITSMDTMVSSTKTASAVGQNGWTYTSLNVDERDGHSLLYDTERHISVYDLDYVQDSTSIGPSPKSDQELATTGCKSGVDALGNLESVEDFYQEYLGWEGLDGKGYSSKPLNVYVQVDNSLNGYWSGDDACIFFTGNENGVQVSAYLDFVAHEFTHAVTQYSSSLVSSPNQDQSYDAINEGISDIMGEAVERDVTGACDWRFGPSYCAWSRNFASSHSFKEGDNCHDNAIALDNIAYRIAEGQSFDGYTKEQTRFFQGGKGTSKQDLDAYVTFWHRVQMGLPGTCSYQQLSDVACQVAKSMCIANEIAPLQYLGILQAFDSRDLVDNATWSDARDTAEKMEESKSVSRNSAVTTLVLDTSGSMNDGAGGDSSDSKLDKAKEATSALLNTLDGMNTVSDGQYEHAGCLVTFANDPTLVSALTNDISSIEGSVESLSANGGTDILAGLGEGIDACSSFEGEKTIILLSDGEDTAGNSNDDILDKASEAKAKGIKVFTIGFGSTADLNEDLLRGIAARADGTYQYADSTKSMDLVGSFLGSQARSTGEVLAEGQGTLSQGQTSEGESFEVDNDVGELHTVLAWPGSQMESVLTDPMGRTVDDSYPGVTVNDTQIPSLTVVSDPVPGTWSISVHATETSQDDEPYYSVVSFRQTGPERNPALAVWQVIAAWALPVGAVLVLASALLLRDT